VLDAEWEALEWAMALARTPAQRTLLRQRSLPSGMERLLQVAAGASDDTVVDFATQTGESEPEIIEAARFYAREILFHQGADAYRVLGVARNADTDSIRTHHRLLQLWLHPDRHSSDWDTIFASRVNAAWSQLRSDERRRAYELANPPQPHDRIPLSQAPGWLPVPQLAIAPQEIGPWRRRAPVLALFATCGVLAVLALRDLQTEPVGRLGEVKEVALPSTDTPENRVDGTVALRLPDALTSGVTRHRQIAVVSPRRADMAPGDKVESAASSLSNSARVAQKSLRMPIVPSTTMPSARVAAAMPPASRSSAEVALANARATPDAVLRLPSPPAKAKLTVGQTNITPRATSKVDEPARKVASALLAVTTQSADSPDRDTAAIVAAGNTNSLSNLRMQQAQQVGEQLITYMSKSSARIPPIWGSLSTQRGAAQLRVDLHGNGTFRIDSPNWRVNDKSASMQAKISYRDGSAGRLSARMAWREQGWLISGLSVERDL
jgi:hypothetical protein